MELDHFRPWNKKFGSTKEKKFKHLRDVPTNLVHACGTCNGFKWAHWPTENPDTPYDHEKGWVDPFNEGRSEFFEIKSDGTIKGLKPPAEYQIKQLRLWRPLLKKLREMRILLDDAESHYRPKWEAIINTHPGSDHAQTARIALQFLDLLKGFYGSA